jgi:tRNA(Ile)-lysidine synthase
MASSKRLLSSKDSLITRVTACLTRVFHHQPQSFYRLLVAYSGGLDSSVLLHLLVTLQQQLRATPDAPFQLQLSAMHVHHGLSAHADVWAQHCQQVCQQYDVPLQVVRVNVDKASGQGVEASARAERYKALKQAQADFICLAHHQQDQAETLLLQLMRGAGPKGLAGMAVLDLKQGLLRPLLDNSRQTLEAYAKAYGLSWVEDDSNADTRYDRNFMRHHVLPLLETQYKGVHKTLSRAAQHMAEASELLGELAVMDASQIAVAGMQANQLCLQVDKLAALTEARAKNLLRWWIAQHALTMPNAELLNQGLQQLKSARKDASIDVQLSPQQSIKRYLGLAYIVEHVASDKLEERLWQGESVIQLNAQDSLIFETGLGQGIAQKHLISTPLRIRMRAGGERFRLALNRPSQTLKHILQTYHVPPWLRDRMPLIWLTETLVCIPNIGVDPSAAALPDEMGVTIRWQTSP